MLKLKKWQRITFKTILVIGGLWLAANIWFYFRLWYWGPDKPGDYSNHIFTEIVNSNLGIPGEHRDWVVNKFPPPKDWDYWYKMDCDIQAKEKHWKPDMTNFFKGQRECVKLDYWDIDRNKSVYDDLCKDYLTCQALRGVIEDYVLNYPEVLRKISEIAERPCDYIKTPEMIPEGKDRQYTLSTIKEVRRMMFCDMPNYYIAKRKFVVIKIKNRKRGNDINMVIRRKDIE